MVISEELQAENASTAECTVSTGVDGMLRSLPASDISFLCILGVFVTLLGTFLSCGPLVLSMSRFCDFGSFVVGAQLLGTHRLYDIPSILAVQRELVGSTHPGIPYTRPPFFAAAMMPFTLLSYKLALGTWKLLLLACLTGSVYLLPYVPRRYVALAICWSVPAGVAVAIGSDAPLMLFFVVLSLAAWKKGRQVLAGLILGLCLAKFHFLVFLAFLLFQKTYRRLLIGFAITASLLVIVNFVVEPGWIPLYWHALNMPQKNMSAMAQFMPDFYGVFFWTGHSRAATVLGGMSVGAILWRLRNLPFELAMPLCILGGLLAAPHTGNNDLLLAIPACLLVASRFSHLRPGAAMLLSPMIVLLSPVMAISAIAAVAPIGPAVLVGAFLWFLLCIPSCNRASVDAAQPYGA